MSERKTLYTLCVDDYAPMVTAVTFPYLEAYAERMGADFVVIRERRFPEWPVRYEKLQIRELALASGADWHVFMDADVLVHPDTPDFTVLLGKATVAQFSCDWSLLGWRPDEYMRRDGRWISSANGLMTICSDWCLDLWMPLDCSFEEAKRRMLPNVWATKAGIGPEHVIDEFVLTRNIARYALDYKSLERDLTPEQQGWLVHVWSPAEDSAKAEALRRVSLAWHGHEEDS